MRTLRVPFHPDFITAYIMLVVVHGIAYRMYRQREDADWEAKWETAQWTHLERRSLTCNL